MPVRRTPDRRPLLLLPGRPLRRTTGLSFTVVTEPVAIRRSEVRSLVLLAARLEVRLEVHLEVRPEGHPSAMDSTVLLALLRLRPSLVALAAGGRLLLDGLLQPRRLRLRTMTGDAGSLHRPGLLEQALRFRSGCGYFGPGP
jgi:hypothetical protein